MAEYIYIFPRKRKERSSSSDSSVIYSPQETKRIFDLHEEHHAESSSEDEITSALNMTQGVQKSLQDIMKKLEKLDSACPPTFRFNRAIYGRIYLYLSKKTKGKILVIGQLSYLFTARNETNIRLARRTPRRIKQRRRNHLRPEYDARSSKVPTRHYEEARKARFN